MAESCPQDCPLIYRCRGVLDIIDIERDTTASIAPLKMHGEELRLEIERLDELIEIENELDETEREAHTEFENVLRQQLRDLMDPSITQPISTDYNIKTIFYQ